VRVDRRVVRTENAIFDAFISLCSEQRYEDISIRQIAERANIGRSTFYAHYNDKEDLVDRRMSHLFQVLTQAMNDDSRDTLLPAYGLLEHVYENRVAAAGLDLHFLSNKFNVHTVKIAKQQLAKKIHGGYQGQQLDVMANMLSGALISVMLSWVRAGMETPPEVIASHFYQALADLPLAVSDSSTKR